MKTPIQIIRLSISHFGIIEAAAINPDDGKPIVLAGDNGQGKSTVLNAIESVLYGRKLAEPVTHGESKAQIKLELGEAGTTKPLYKVEQIIKKDADGTSCYNLKILDADGKQVPSPARFIESLIGSGAALDPTEIMQARPGERPETFAKRQAETLMNRLGLTEKAGKLDVQITAKTEERKKAKDEAASLQARFDALEIAPNTPDEPVDVAALGTRQTELMALQTQRQRLSDKIQPKIESAAAALKRVNELKRLLAEAEEIYQGALKLSEDAQTELETFDESNPTAGIAKGLSEVQEKMANANKINLAVQHKKDRKAISTELTKAESKATSTNTELEKLRKERLDLVRAAKLPVADLELTADALLYKGQPLTQESTGNQIRICSLLAMAEEPDCRVLFLREGSLTNKANLKTICDIASERGYQVWIERFTETPIKDALWIEGGKVMEA